MPTYVVPSNWTDEGIRNVRSTVERADRASQLAEKYGASMTQIYWTVGPYDFVNIVEAPDDFAGRVRPGSPARSSPCG